MPFHSSWGECRIDSFCIQIMPCRTNFEYHLHFGLTVGRRLQLSGHRRNLPQCTGRLLFPGGIGWLHSCIVCIKWVRGSFLVQRHDGSWTLCWVDHPTWHFITIIMEIIYISLFHTAQSAFTLIITPIDQVSIWNHLNFLGSIQSGCLLVAQRLAIWQYCVLSDIGYPFTAGWTGEVLTRFEPGNFRTANERSHHCATVFPCNL